MLDWGIIAPLVGLIAFAVFALAWMRLRFDPGKARGSEPKQGDHVLTADYQSGLGGHSTTWRVPADPQEYAKKFVPKDKT
ncbi:MAG: hypothetical protein MK098_14035 [Marinovum sp.]|nr:hypothetical protein [Marinovum sp.]